MTVALGLVLSVLFGGVLWLTWVAMYAFFGAYWLSVQERKQPKPDTESTSFHGDAKQLLAYLERLDSGNSS